MTTLFRPLGSTLITRRLPPSHTGDLVVLGYHDLRSPGDFASWMRVEVGRFRDQLEVLSSVGRFLAPSDLSRRTALPAGSLSFLVTFDDGYANHLYLAAPVLESMRIPALFFISTLHMASGEPFWFDRVVTRLQAARLDRLDLSRFGLREYRFAPGDDRRRWEGIQPLLRDLKRLGNAADSDVAMVLDYLDAEYGEVAAPYDRSFRPITTSEASAVAARPGLTLGSHAHRHDILTRLGDAALGTSLEVSRQLLTQAAARPIEDIAYPNGDHDVRVRAACQRAGYHRGYTAERGLASHEGDSMLIPRLLVGGYDTVRDLLAGINRLLIASRLTHA